MNLIVKLWYNIEYRVKFIKKSLKTASYKNGEEIDARESSIFYNYIYPSGIMCKSIWKCFK